MKNIYNYLLIFIIGAVSYSVLEIIWRGYTHISMALAGGISLMALFYLERKAKRLPLVIKCVIGALFITLVEFCFGCVVNMAMDLNVWDYSDRSFNIMGQICPLYTLLWFVICIPALGICKTVNRVFDKQEN